MPSSPSLRASLGLAALGLVGCGSSGGGAGPDASADATTLEGGGDAALDGAADAGEDVVARGARTLGLDINAASDGNYLTAFSLAHDAGVQSVNVTVDWSSLESIPDGGLDGGDAGIAYFNPNLHIANLVFQDLAKVSLAVRAVDTSGLDVPSDLAARSLDDPAVIGRYNAAQDYVFDQIPDLKLSMYVIGNEVDLPFGTNPTKWAAYTAFFEGAAAHAHALRSGVQVGTVVTLAGATAHPELVRPTLAHADFLGITYYPVRADFSARPTSDVRADVDALVALYPSMPIYFREAGYPSSPDLGSSPNQQAAFVTELFRAWDAHADRIPLVTFFTMTEYSPDALTQLAAYYGSSDPKFLAYLGSLGLRTYAPATGTNKPGWDALTAGARARGW